MEYSLNVKVLEKLVDVESKILDSFRIMAVFKNLSKDSYNKELFTKELSRLKVLVKKENILIEQLPQYSEILKYIYNIVLQNQHNFFDDENIMIDIVLKRFENVMIDLVNLYEDKEEEELLEEVDIDYDDIDKYSYRIMIRDNLNLKNIVYLNDLMNLYDKSFQNIFISTQISMGYFYKNIGDELIKNKFDISKITYYEDDALAKMLHLPREEYESLKNDEIYNMTQELFFEMLSSLFDENNIDNNLPIIKDSLRFKFLLHEMPTQELIMFNELASDNINSIDNLDDLVKEVMSIIEMELHKRTDLPKKVFEDNISCNPVDEKTARGLINLIKIEEKLLNVFDSIDFLSNNNKEIFAQLSNLVNIEKECISDLDVSYRTLEVVDNMLCNDMDFFFDYYVSEDENQRKKSLIYERLNNIIPFYQRMNLSPTQSEKSYTSINQNHIVSTLKIFDNKIFETENIQKKEAMMKLYKDLFFINGVLFDDYIQMNGNYKMIDRFSDYATARSIGISDNEYGYDKDEQLYEKAKEIIDEILSYEDAWVDDLDILALFEFKLSELSDIMLNVSDEHIYSLPSVVKENNTYKSPKSKKIIRNIIKK